MITKVRGKNIAVFIYDGGFWKLYACGRACTLNRITDFVETSVSGSGKFKTFEPTANSFTGEITGVMHINKSGMINLADFDSLWQAQTKLLMRFQRTSDEGVVYTSEASFFISNLSDTGDYTDVAQYTVSLQGTGGITIIQTPILSTNINKMKRLEYTGVGGEVSFTNSLLIGKDIQVVEKDGIGNSKIILTGTPVGKEVLFTSATGTLEWAIPFEIGEEAWVNYQDI